MGLAVAIEGEKNIVQEPSVDPGLKIDARENPILRRELRQPSDHLRDEKGRDNRPN